ncbi:MAG TPA: triple tyrosine motif-containing protein, partial [bacterium]|nr:triple tyrosine motif-containing protein [bacterium]
SILEDAQGKIWVGTSGGLNRIDPSNDKILQITEKHGLPNDVIASIQQDGNGQLWVSTNKGLSRIDINNFENGGPTAHNRIRNFDVFDGLQSNEFSMNAGLRAREGWMYFGGINGFNVFHPDSVRDNPFIPQIAVTGFQKFNRNFEFATHISETEEIHLSYKDYVFSFEFAALNFRAPGKNQYAYIMEGFETDWNFVGSKRTASYTNLDPGSYTFRVRASNNDDIWNTDGVKIAVVIHPPFWMTWWFRIAVVILLLSVTYVIYRRRVYAIELRKRELENEVRERTFEVVEKNKMLDEQNSQLAMKNQQIREQQAQIIQSKKMASLGQMVAGIAHEVNNPLTFVIGNIQQIKETCDQLKSRPDDGSGVFKKLHAEMMPSLEGSMVGGMRIKAIIDNLKRFSNLNESDWKLISLEDNLDIICDLFIKQYDFVTIEKKYNGLPAVYCNTAEINQALVNILTNAVQAIQDRGLKEGQIDLSTSTQTVEQNEYVVVSIRDNGIGMSSAVMDKIYDPFFTTRDVGSGRGLGLTEAYGIVQRHHGKIEVWSEVGKGSEFTVYLPVRKRP